MVQQTQLIQRYVTEPTVHPMVNGGVHLQDGNNFIFFFNFFGLFIFNINLL